MAALVGGPRFWRVVLVIYEAWVSFLDVRCFRTPDVLRLSHPIIVGFPPMSCRPLDLFTTVAGSSRRS